MSVLFLIIISFVFGFYCSKYEQRSDRTEIKKLTILQIEEKYPVEILSPMVRELQTHANRHGAEIIEDNIYGPETARQMERVRCNQMYSLVMQRMHDSVGAK